MLPSHVIKREPDPCWGEVLSVGDDVHGIEPGQIVFFNDAETHELHLPDGEIIVLRDMCIMATIDKDDAKRHGLFSA